MSTNQSNTLTNSNFPMNSDLFEATKSGDKTKLINLSSQNPNLLLGTTPQENTCLHLSVMLGQEDLARAICSINPSLLLTVNSDLETPLIAAVIAGHVQLASGFLETASAQSQPQFLSEMIMKVDKDGDNVLHHAIRNGFEKFTMELLQKEPRLSEQVNRNEESPMFIAAFKGIRKVVEKLLEFPLSSDVGPENENALFASVRAGNADITKILMEQRSELANRKDKSDFTAIHYAVIWNKVKMVKVMLEHYPSLAYTRGESSPLILKAAKFGHVYVAKELMKHCPDVLYARSRNMRWNALHQAVEEKHEKFVEFILNTPQLLRLINQSDIHGDTPLHIASRKCSPRIIRALLAHKALNIGALNKHGKTALHGMFHDKEHLKTLSWNEVFMLLAKADPEDYFNFARLKAVKQLKHSAKKQIISLTQTYTGNTSLVATLIATVTFAAAFTLPGGYSSNSGLGEGLPVLARKAAFKIFLISDTLAMCSSFAVAFLCILARWEDLDFLLHYRKLTTKLMWFAYSATTITFATGLYTVLEANNLWLAIFICVICCSIPFLTKLLGHWPISKLRLRVGNAFNSDLLDMV
ncbi:hypothetical protein LUZ60_005211 [Juncus effusus]|nr:hypothetical protein LUZ60_005211 [Juncus effusus]